MGGADYCAVRRNTIADASGRYAFCGIEGIGAYCVYTNNTIDGGQKIGLSVSNTHLKDYGFWGYNTVRACNQWGAQFQGESTGAAYHYFYRCRFSDMPKGVGPVLYPGAEGMGFRFNGHCHHMVFEECAFTDNARVGIQFCGEDIDELSFVRCTIAGNQSGAATPLTDYTALAWEDCTVRDNGTDALPEDRPFSQPPPEAAFIVEGEKKAGEELRFRSTSTAAAGKIVAALWDFDDGIPATEPENTHTYEAPGTYRVTLIVWDESGRGARCTQEVRVLEAQGR